MFNTLRNFFTTAGERPHSSTEAAPPAVAESYNTAFPDGWQPIPLAPLVRGLQPLMRIGIYGLSENPGRHGETIDYILPKSGNATVTVGAAGLPTVFDFDFVILLASQMTYLTKHGAQKPQRVLDMYVSEMLRYCLRRNSNREAAQLEYSLQRLKETTINASYPLKSASAPTQWKAEGFISDFEVLLRNQAGQPEIVRIYVPDWMYDWIVLSRGKQALPLSHNYFHVTNGVARYLYLLASSAAGSNETCWGRRRVYEHSGSTIPLEQFWNIVCKQVKKERIPGFEMKIQEGEDEPLLAMRRELCHFPSDIRPHPDLMLRRTTLRRTPGIWNRSL